MTELHDAAAVAPARRRRRPAPERERSHNEIYARLEQVAAQAAEGARKADAAAAAVDLMYGAAQRTELMVAGLVKQIGVESEDDMGARHGTGLVGRMMRLEMQVKHRFGQYDRWTAMVLGAVAVLIPMGPVIWWLLNRTTLLK